MAKKKAKIQTEATTPESTEPILETASATVPESEAAAETRIQAEIVAQSDAEPGTGGGEGFKPITEPVESTAALPEAEEPSALKGHDLSRAATAKKSTRALAPEGSSPSISPESSSIPAASETEIEAEDSPEPESDESPEPEDDSEPEVESKPRPPAKLERLQKILAAAGIASRRSAEALIEQGRVQVNGKVVTVLGTKADLGRDHIRVDGKLLQGPERLRYFVLNKPRGFVTTVKDPEGRPTVMQFFDKMKERLYPVGRLDYMSEGLLVVTNDGDLANRLTKASSGVEKTYLVKVAGQPTEAELNILRGGVAIERGAPGSPKVHTSPARIRQVRQGDNPWYEVVLIEGRNRELRKMFEEVGHFVEKIRRTGYGPLVLDQEPGNLRELEPRELDLLRLAAEGKLRTPKSKEVRRRNAVDAGILPTVRPKPSSRPRPPAQPFAPPPAATERPASERPRNLSPDRPNRPARPFDKRGPAKPFRSAKPFRPDRVRPDRGGGEEFRPAAGRTSAPNPVRSFSHSEEERPRRTGMGGQTSFGSARPAGRSFDRPAYERPNTGSARPASAGTGRPGAGRPFTAKPKFDKPAWKKPERSGKPAFQRPAPPRREAPASPAARAFDEDLGPVRPPNLHIEEITGSDRPTPTRSSYSRPPVSRPSFNRPSSPHSGSPRSDSDRPSTPTRPSRPSSPGRPSFERPASSARSGGAKPFRGEGGLARPFTTSSGKPRAGGARPSSKSGAPAGRSSSAGWKPGKFSKPGSSKPGSSKPGSFKSYGDKPAGRSSAGPAKRPFRRDEGEGSFTPRPRADSASRPSGSSRPFTPRPERKSGPGWKPKPAFGGPGKPASGSRSKPKPGAFTDRPSSAGRKPGGFKSSGYKGKPSGPRPGTKRPGGKPGGKKRG